MNLKFLLAALLVFVPFARAANPSYGSFETATQFATNNLRIAIKDGVIVTNILAWTGSVEERLRIGGVLSFDHGEFLLPAATNDISVFDASYYRLISDDTTATNRIVRLSAGSFDGQFVILENGADTRFLLRDSDTTWDTGDQVYLVADWSPTNRQSLILLWDGIDTSWIEQERVGTFGGGGEIQGTLTPTFIPFANGVTTLGDSGLYSITFTQLGLGDQWTNSFLANNGTQNTWLGNNAGSSLTTASQSVGVGYGALDSATSSSNNVAVGYNSLTAVTTGGNGLTAVGHSALAANTTGIENTALGTSSGSLVTTGIRNTAVGFQALENETTASHNTAIGGYALESSQGGPGSNTGVGSGALRFLTTGTGNTGVGATALGSVSTGGSLVGVGSAAGSGMTTGQQGVFIGNASGPSGTGGALNNLIAVGNGALTGLLTGGGSTIGLGTSIGLGITNAFQSIIMGQGNGTNLNNLINSVVLSYPDSSDASATNKATGFTNAVFIGHSIFPTNSNEIWLGNSTNNALRLARDRGIHWGTGSPEAAVTANTGSLFLRDDGSTATSLYIKTANDSANTGWTAVDPSGGGGGTLWEYSSDTLRPIADPTRITITTNRQMTLGRATSIPADLTYVLESGRFRDLGDNARSQFYLWNASDATFVDIVDFSLDMTSSATAPYSQLSISAQKASGSNSVFVVRTDNDVTDRIQFNVNGTARIDMLPNTADGASAVAYTFDTANYLDDAGALLARFRNFGTNKLTIAHDGDLNMIKGVAYSWPSAQGGASTVLQNNGSGTLSWAAGASGDFVGPASSLDNGIVVFSGTTGKLGKQATSALIAGDGSQTTVTLTGNVSGTDPVLTFGSALVAVNPSAQLSVGTTSPNSSFRFQAHTDSASTFGAFSSYGNTASFEGSLYLLRGRGTFASPLAVLSGDTIGVLRFAGQFNTTLGNFSTGAKIEAIAAGNWALNDIPTALVFYTTPASSGTAVERLRINQNGLLQFAGTTASFPAIKRSATELQVRLADDSAGALMSVGAGTSSSQARVGGNLKTDTTQTGNVGTGEDNLITFSVPASTLANNGDYLEYEVSGTLGATVNAKRVRVYFGATAIYDTTSLVLNGLDWNCHGKIIRTGATTQKATATFTIAGTLLGATTTTSTDYTTPAETLSGAVTFKVTGEATDNNDVVQEIQTIRWYPNN